MDLNTVVRTDMSPGFSDLLTGDKIMQASRRTERDNETCSLDANIGPQRGSVSSGAPLPLAAPGTTPLFRVMSRRTASRFTFSFAAASLHEQHDRLRC